ncbi:hypothetical protein [Helicobacter sp. 23-1046]
MWHLHSVNLDYILPISHRQPPQLKNLLAPNTIDFHNITKHRVNLCLLAQLDVVAV